MFTTEHRRKAATWSSTSDTRSVQTFKRDAVAPSGPWKRGLAATCWARRYPHQVKPLSRLVLHSLSTIRSLKRESTATIPGSSWALLMSTVSYFGLVVVGIAADRSGNWRRSTTEDLEWSAAWPTRDPPGQPPFAFGVRSISSAGKAPRTRRSVRRIRSTEGASSCSRTARMVSTRGVTSALLRPQTLGRPPRDPGGPGAPSSGRRHSRSPGTVRGRK